MSQTYDGGGGPAGHVTWSRGAAIICLGHMMGGRWSNGSCDLVNGCSHCMSGTYPMALDRFKVDAFVHIDFTSGFAWHLSGL